MKKIVFLIIATIFVLQVSAFAAAGSFDVVVKDKAPVIVAELGNPAQFELAVTNNMLPDSFKIYSLRDITMTPVGFFPLTAGANTIEVSALPSQGDIRDMRGLYLIDYQLSGQSQGIVYTGKLSARIISLKDTLLVLGDNLMPDDSTIKIKIRNVNNIQLDNMDIDLKSVFFEVKQTLSLKPFEQTEISVPADKERLKTIMAGMYPISVKLTYSGKTVNAEGSIDYLEKEGTSISRTTTGLIIRKTIIKKTNEGNVPVTARIDASKDVLSRLFTTFSVEPTTSTRSGLVSDYVWEKNLVPSESYEVVITTNYTFPLILIILVVIIALLVRAVGRSDVVLKKRVSFVKSKGGEFALKVTLHVKAKKDVNNLIVADRLPHSVQLYGTMGKKPDRIDENGKKLVWNIGRLTSGEGRVFSYIIYSKVNIVGRFELPNARAVFDSGKEKKFASSNKTYFVSDSLDSGE